MRGRTLSEAWKNRKHLLGTRPDAELAAEWSVTRQRVQQMRKYFNIPAFRRQVPWSTIDPLLGITTDEELAARFNVSIELVRMRRRTAGRLASYGEVAYELVVEHGSIREAAEHADMPRSSLAYQARAFAMRSGKPWPVQHPKTETPTGERAYDGFMAGASGEDIAAQLGGSPRSAQTSAYRYAAKHDLARPNKTNRLAETSR